MFRKLNTCPEGRLHRTLRDNTQQAIVCQSVCVLNLLGYRSLCQEASVYRESDCAASSGPVKVREGTPPVMTRHVTPVALRLQKGIFRLILWLFSHALSSALVTGLWHRMGVCDGREGSCRGGTEDNYGKHPDGFRSLRRDVSNPRQKRRPLNRDFPRELRDLCSSLNGLSSL